MQRTLCWEEEGAENIRGRERLVGGEREEDAWRERRRG